MSRSVAAAPVEPFLARLHLTCVLALANRPARPDFADERADLERLEAASRSRVHLGEQSSLGDLEQEHSHLHLAFARHKVAPNWRSAGPDERPLPPETQQRPLLASGAG